MSEEVRKDKEESLGCGTENTEQDCEHQHEEECHGDHEHHKGRPHNKRKPTGEHHHHDDECCGHDHDEHEHHHDGECCGHDHDEHEHHHDGECCGHDHDEHEHHHDGEGCNHDHDEHEHHHHDHGHKHDVEGYSLFETHIHEGATVCSFEKTVAIDKAGAVPVMETAVGELKDWLNSEGAIIGHVKGYVRAIGEATTFSTVGAGVNVIEHPAGGAEIGFASIVFGPSEEKLKDKVIELFAGLK